MVPGSGVSDGTDGTASGPELASMLLLRTDCGAMVLVAPLVLAAANTDTALALVGNNGLVLASAIW